MREAILTWQFWALLSAVFAALTAIFAKGRDRGGSVRFRDLRAHDRDHRGARRNPDRDWRLAGAGIGPGAQLGLLVLSGLATGASWICYFRALKLGHAARVAPIDKLSVVLVAVFGALFLREHLSTTNWLGVALIGAFVICGALPG